MSAEVLVATSAVGPELDDLVRLEAACLDDPWSAGDLALYFGAGAVVGFRLLPAPASAGAVAYALFQLLPGECELLRVGVEPRARRRGHARRLLTAALEHLRAGGRPVCHLEVRAGNAPARALYESLGFRLVGLRRRYYDDGEDAARYRLGEATPGG